MSECLIDMCLAKIVTNLYPGDDEAKDLVLICDHVHFSHKNKWTKTASSPLKWWGCGKTHVTVIQEMNMSQ